jgi:outer membrane cobalamin receptor
MKVLSGQWLGRGLALSWVLSLSLIFPEVASSAKYPTIDPAKDTLELLRQESLTTFELGELVPSDRERFGPLSRTYEVTAKDILAQTARNVGEALRFVPGVIYGQGGLQNEGSIIIRGIGHRQGLSSNDKTYSVFIDGRPVHEPFLGTVDLFNLPIDNVAKIKIIKGAASAPFGPNTMGGVINIITKQGTSKPTTEATISYEEHNSQDYQISHGGQKDKLRYFVAGSIRKTNGFPLSDDFTTTPLQPNDDLRIQSDYEKYNVSLNLGYDFTEEDKIAFLGGYYQSKFGIPPPTTGYKAFQPEFGRFTFWQRYFFDLTGETRVSDSTLLKGKVYFDKFDNDLTFYDDETYSSEATNRFTGAEEVSVFDNFLLGSNLQATVEPIDDVTVKAGTFVRWDHVKRQRDTLSPHEKYETLTLDFFTQAEYFPFENLMLSAGLNWDALFTLNSHFDRTDKSKRISAFSPNGSVIYKPWPETRLHTTIANRHNLPTMQNVYGFRAGNLDVDTEKVFSLEVGATQLFWNKLVEVEATFFYNDAHDIIELKDRSSSIPLEPFGTSTVKFDNTDSFTTIGSELLLTLNWYDEFSTRLGYTYVNTDSQGRGGSLDAGRGAPPLDDDSALLERPKHQVTLLANYESPIGFSGYVQGSYQSDYFDTKALGGDPNEFDTNEVIKVQGRFLFNGKIAYEVWKGVKPFLMVENIFDSNYEAIRGYPRPGRRFFFGVNAKFESLEIFN